MTATTDTKLIQFSEYLLRPYDRKHTELVDGKIIEMSEASPLHVLIIKLLQKLLDAHLTEIESELDTFSGCGIEIPRTNRNSNARDPDLVVCSSAQFEDMLGLTKAIFLSGNPPALAVEVASPGGVSRDTREKRTEYALAQVPEYWIVNPVDGYVLVMVLNGQSYREVGTYRGEETIRSALLPQFKPQASVLLNGKKKPT